MLTSNGIINLHQRSTYLIAFRWTMGQKYIVQGVQIMDVLKTCDSGGVEFIKLFDIATNTFKRVARSRILSEFSFDTEVYEYLTGHYFFK